jgi:hypothetical protein
MMVQANGQAVPATQAQKPPEPDGASKGDEAAC